MAAAYCPFLELLGVRMARLRTLPKVRDNISFVYFEHCRIEQDDQAIAILKERDKMVLPCASIATLLLGPGTTITHAAIKALTDNCCEVHWVGQDLMRFYASGKGGSSNTDRLQHQVNTWADSLQRLGVVRRMYEFRFEEDLPQDLSLQQIRGHEGVRVRTLYGQLSAATGVEWQGRDYKQDNWQDADPINKALSIANSCIYGVCQAALNSVGYSSALGFVHTGKPLSFAYDVADLYKAETTIPAAFEAVASGALDLDAAVRRLCREKFVEHRLMHRLVGDVDRLLLYGNQNDEEEGEPFCFLWDDQLTKVEGGKNWSDD
jgi:CRISP-associated protein Cas1